MNHTACTSAPPPPPEVEGHYFPGPGGACHMAWPADTHCRSGHTIAPPPMEKRKQWADTAAWWIFVTRVGLGEGRPGRDLCDWQRLIDAASCQENSQFAGLHPPPPYPPGGLQALKSASKSKSKSAPVFAKGDPPHPRTLSSGTPTTCPPAQVRHQLPPHRTPEPAHPTNHNHVCAQGAQRSEEKIQQRQSFIIQKKDYFATVFCLRLWRV